MRNLALVFLGCVALSGCVAVWQDSYHIEYANDSSISINSDPMFVNAGGLQKVAQQHCQKFGRDAVPRPGENSPWGLRLYTFDCVSKH